MAQKILVVDDKPFMVRLIQHHLQKAGYELIQARNKKEAVEAVARETPDLVVIDDSGTEREKVNLEDLGASGSEVPLIRMTDAPDSVEGRTFSGEFVVKKPFSPTKLVAEIKRMSAEGSNE